MKIAKSQSVPPVMPVIGIQPTDNGYRPLHPLPDKRKQADGTDAPPVVFKGPVSTHEGARTASDMLTFKAREKVRPLIGIYTRDGRII